ncbi:MAG TPA: penicillin-binding transpeptidase domain-containing protein, partial [Marmoricola sp.]|nr:penicillin-binding transpeptidase domain-containing protein [Marmoricola sp.]
SGDSRWKLPGTNTYLANEEGQSCGATKVTMTLALANSCNVAFGQLGDALGNSAISTQAERFGFGQRYFNELDDTLVHQSTSVFPSTANRPNTVLSAIGQYETTATPLQMALVAAGIANGGTVMAPYLVNGIQAPNLNMVYQATPKPLNSSQPAVSPSVATQLTQMMSAVVQYGTGTTAQIPGIQVAGKTGTAQSCNTCNPYSWFVSFGPTTNAKVAVAVQLQFLEQPTTTQAMNAVDIALGIRPGSGTYVARSNITGRGFAAPVAKCVMEAVITPNNLTADCKA